MGNHLKSLKPRVKRAQRCGFFSLSLGCLILMSILSSSWSFSIFSTDEATKWKMPEHARELDLDRLFSPTQTGRDFGKPTEDVWAFLGTGKPKVDPITGTKFGSRTERGPGFIRHESRSETVSGPTMEIKMDDPNLQRLADQLFSNVNLHIINDELSALNQAAKNNKNNNNQNFSPDLIFKMKDKGIQIKDGILHQFNKTTNNLHNVQHKVQEKVETQADKIKENGLNIFNALRDKILPPKNFSQHENAENTTALTPPQFFLDEGFKGLFYIPSASMLKTKSKCVNFPSSFSGKISSLKTGGHCVLVCPKRNCRASWEIGNFKTLCTKYAAGFTLVETLDDVRLDNKIQSFKLC